MFEGIKDNRVSAAAFVIIILIGTAIAGLYFFNIFNWGSYPDFGFGFRTATGIKVAGVVTENGERSGLKVGDRFVEINGETFTNIMEFRALMHRELGEENTYLIERQGRRFALTIKNIPIGFKSSFYKSGFLFLLGLCYAVIGLLVFLMKPHAHSSWVFLIFTIIFGLFIAYLYKISTMKPFWIEYVHIFIYTFTPATFIHLALSFPQERKILQSRPWFQMVPYIVAALLFIYAATATTNIMDAPRPVLISVMAYLAISVIWFLGSCIQLRFRSSSEIVKLRARMILLGFGIAASVPLLDFISSVLLRVYLIPNFNFYLPFFIVFPIFVGYSIVKHDLFDIDTLIKRTYGYVMTTGVLAGIYGIFVLVTNLAFGGFEFARSPAFPLGFIMIVVFLFNPIRNRVQRFIDRVFYRLEYNYQETVKKISETMRSLLDLDRIGKAVMDTALGTMFIDAGAVMLINREGSAYDCLIQSGEKEDLGPKTGVTDDEIQEGENYHAADRSSDMTCKTLSADEPLMQKMAEKKKEVTIYDIQENPLFEGQREACEKVFEQLGATLLVPLIYEDQLSGLISLGRKKSGKFYRREDINLLNILANQGAVAIENARMVEDVVEKERMEEELNIARDLQVSMLPAETPQVAGFEIAAYSMSAREVGGDFYDFIEMGANKAGMVIGDVTGKSVSGALVMSASRTLFRTLSEEELSVKDSMMRANQRLKKDVKSGMFVALLYAVIDSQDKILTLCSAGQTQPIHVAAKTGEGVLVETRGDTFPLGILDDSKYEETSLQLEAGDKIILYTDGIVEAMNEEEEIFGFDRLLEVVKNSQAMTAETLLNEVKIKVNEFAGSAPQHDDITVIVLSVNKV